jgi:hypothetical protein
MDQSNEAHSHPATADESQNVHETTYYPGNRGRASLELAKLFSRGSIPMAPSNYIQQLISRIRVPKGIRISDEGLHRLRQCLEITPKSTKEMRRLIGGINYANSVFNFTDSPSRFGELMKPLHESVSMKTFKYTEESARSVMELKSRIRNHHTPFVDIDSLLDEHHILVITTDACDSGVGARHSFRDTKEPRGHDQRRGLSGNGLPCIE